MPHEYHLLPRLVRWLRRFRKRKGYGVHSPLAFQFITDVVYNASPYYAYAALSQPLEPSLSRGDEYDPVSGLTAKDLRLLFRLANYQEATRILLLGASPAVEAHIAAARTTAVRVVASQPPASSLFPPTSSLFSPPSPDLLYCDTPDLLPATLLEAESAMVIVRGIHRTPAASTRWKQLMQHPHVTLTFDLGRFGIVLRRPKINRQDYVVNYF